MIDMENDTITILTRVVFAMAIGSIVGIERERKNKPAGIRTYMLVAGASALLLLINEEVANQFAALSDDNTAADPTRIVQAIIIGISFIGAGTIFKSSDKEDILFLTTAASILFTAGLGIVAGLGMFVLAASLTAIVVSVLYLVGLFEEKTLNNRK